MGTKFALTNIPDMIRTQIPHRAAPFCCTWNKRRIQSFHKYVKCVVPPLYILLFIADHKLLGRILCETLA
jgi:hypothetical protein